MPLCAMDSNDVSSISGRDMLVTSRPTEVWCTWQRRTRVELWPSRAMAGLSVPEMSQPSTVPRASPLARTPLARAPRIRQSRTRGPAVSPMTTAEVPKFSNTQSSTTLALSEESTRPAPPGLPIRQPRAASEPLPRISSAVHPAPVTVHPSSAA